MSEQERKMEEELNNLKHEIEDFRSEKERVKAIVGKIGGLPTFNTKIFNLIFASIILTCLAVSLISEGTLRLAMLEVATGALSVKLIYILHKQTRVNHFELWVLSSLEWRINEMSNILKEMSKTIKPGK